MDYPIITVTDGQLKGTIRFNVNNESIYAFLGIPYAKPPIGNLRFKAPLPAEPWDGIRDSTKEGPQSIQKGVDDFTMLTEKIEEFIGSEDCLYLNVFTKKLPNQENKLKPVMVFIHGGAFVMGSGSDTIYPPVTLMTEDIVLVTINYRIGVLGFLSLEDTCLEVPGNAGLKDQTLALKWVQKNIAYFNGDPNNVTIFGESAGGASVHFQILSPSANGLFHKAIAQSGNALSPWASSDANAIDFVKYLGISTTNEKDILEKLLKLPVERILEAQYRFCSEKNTILKIFGPVIEIPNKTEFISKHPIDIIRSGEYNKIPMIFGYTSNEGLLEEYLKLMSKQQDWSYKNLTFEDYLSWTINQNIENDAKEAIIEKMKNVYENKKNILNPYLVSTDSLFLANIIAAVNNHVKVQKESIYLYRMSVYTLCNYIGHFLNIDPELGVCHGDDLGYLFNSSIYPNNSPENIAIRRFVKLWTNFAKFGNPTPEKNELGVLWKPVTMNSRNFLDIGFDLISGSNPNQERVQLWKEIYHLHQQTVPYLE